MCSWWTYSSISSVVMPGRTISPARRRISAATAPARRMRAMISGDLTRGSSHGTGTPVSAYGGRPMCSGTARIGDTTPGQHPALGALVAALVLAPAPAPARVVGLRQRRGCVGERAHALQDTAVSRGPERAVAHSRRASTGRRASTLLHSGAMAVSDVVDAGPRAASRTSDTTARVGPACSASGVSRPPPSGCPSRSARRRYRRHPRTDVVGGTHRLRRTATPQRPRTCRPRRRRQPRRRSPRWPRDRRRQIGLAVVGGAAAMSLPMLVMHLVSPAGYGLRRCQGRCRPRRRDRVDRRLGRRCWRFSVSVRDRRRRRARPAPAIVAVRTVAGRRCGGRLAGRSRPRRQAGVTGCPTSAPVNYPATGRTMTQPRFGTQARTAPTLLRRRPCRQHEPPACQPQFLAGTSCCSNQPTTPP